MIDDDGVMEENNEALPATETITAAAGVHTEMKGVLFNERRIKCDQSQPVAASSSRMATDP